MVLAAIAARTTRILLGSAVTVLSTDDPVRVFQRFSTLNALSNGRAEVILGRGSFTESYPLFGYDLSRLRGAVRGQAARCSPSCSSRAAGDLERVDPRRPCTSQIVYPPVETGTLRTWVGVGGSPESVVRAARYGLPLTLAIIGGSPQRFRPYVDLYRQSLEQFGKPMLPIAVHSPGHVAATDEQAKERAVAALPGDDHSHRRASAAGRRRRARTSTAKPVLTARCASARPRPSRRRSRGPCRRSAFARST